MVRKQRDNGGEEKVTEKEQYCPNCGTKLTGSPKFCPKCGLQLTQNQDDAVSGESVGTTNQAPTPKRPHNKKKRVIIVILLALVIILVIVGGYLIKKTVSETSVDSDQSAQSSQSATYQSSRSQHSSASSSSQQEQDSASSDSITGDDQLVKATMTPNQTAAAIAVYADRVSIWPAISSDGMASHLNVAIETNDFDLSYEGQDNVRYDVQAGDNGTSPMLCYTLKNGTVALYTVYGDEEGEISPMSTTTLTQIVDYLNSENEAQSVENLAPKVVISDQR